MAVELTGLKLRRADGGTIQLTGSAVLQPDGNIDLFGDAMDHAGAIAKAVEAFDATVPVAEQRLGECCTASCFGCPSRRGNSACACLVAVKVRVGEVSTLNPITLRPGQPAALVRGDGDAMRGTLTRELTTFRAMRSIATAKAA